MRLGRALQGGDTLAHGEAGFGGEVQELDVLPEGLGRVQHMGSHSRLIVGKWAITLGG